MDEVLLTVAQIRECVLKFVEKAKVKIPEFLEETWNAEYHYVSELFEKDGDQLIFAFKCNPALQKEEMKKMMVCCVVCSPNNGVEMEKPLMYESIETVVATIGGDEMVNESIKLFEGLLQEMKDLNIKIMKKLIMTMMAVVFAITANAQYNVGTSSTTTDYFGNTTTTHRDRYGNTTGSQIQYRLFR